MIPGLLSKPWYCATSRIITFTAENAERAEFKKLFSYSLRVLCDLCGKLKSLKNEQCFLTCEGL
jgi:hypothetical protein